MAPVAETARPSTAAFAAATLLAAAVAVAALTAGHAALAGNADEAARLVRAASLADAAAHVAAANQGDAPTRDASLTKMAKQHAPLLENVLVIASGGADEFGIERGSGVVYASEKPEATATTALLDAAKSRATAAEVALQKKRPMDGARLMVTLPNGVLALVQPFRAAQNKSEIGGAVALLLRPVTPPDAPWLLWLLPLLAVGAALVTRKHLGERAAPTLALAVSLALVVLLLPALPSQASAGVTLLADGWLVPHTPVGAVSAAGPAWLLGSALLLTLLLGPIVAGFASVLAALRKDPVPYFYVGPALLATGVLVFVPFAVGVGLSFLGGNGQFIGLANYREVADTALDPHSSTHFARTLAMTVAWTLINVLLHVTIGLALALVLNQPKLRGRAFYRLLLIVPWAVPSYITALTWKWLFNTQYGPINAMLGLCGVGKVDWLGDSVATNFTANLLTNVWLGFPFMMVVSLGALQSIPTDLYEAADIDGATAWQKFRHVTWPLLKPALFPAVIMGIIWTFNAFNVIYLVSGGGPDHKTDILITEAYFAFSVLRRHGLAAAYSVMIFLLLLGYTMVTQRRSKATEAVNG
jgi:ABC-type sugar transport system permease subunit